VLLVLQLAIVAALVEGHSWVACTDYGQENGIIYDNNLCSSYARNFVQNGVVPTFGVDMGYNYQAASGVPPCKYSMQQAAATTNITRYQRGQRVCLVWPSKNHVAANCTNQWIPDTLLQVMATPVNLTADPPTVAGFNDILTTFGPHTYGTIDFKGFQNCPNFCNNMDKSLCTGCFDIPDDLLPGTYVFMWYWIFNPGSVPYTTCWDVDLS